MKNKILWAAIAVIFCFCGCGKENQVVMNDTTVDTEQVQQEEQKQTQSAPLSLMDMSPVTSIQELWEISDFAVNAKVLTRTERTAGYNHYIDYKIEVNEWLKGEKNDTKELLLTVYDNETGIYAGEQRYYDFDLNENYVFFMTYDEGRDFYWLSNQSAGFIKVESDNRVQVQENDLVFGKCKTYNDVLEIIDSQK